MNIDMYINSKHRNHTAQENGVGEAENQLSLLALTPFMNVTITKKPRLVVIERACFL